MFGNRQCKETRWGNCYGSAGRYTVQYANNCDMKLLLKYETQCQDQGLTLFSN